METGASEEGVCSIILSQLDVRQANPHFPDDGPSAGTPKSVPSGWGCGKMRGLIQTCVQTGAEETALFSASEQ